MIPFERFENLDDATFFVDFVESFYKEAWTSLSGTSGSTLTVDRELIKFACDLYNVNIESYTKVLNSKNPDHYKRAGALLHALYRAQPIVAVQWSEAIERLTNFDNVGVSYGDVQHWENYTSWANNYANPGMAFDLAFRCCQLYEEKIIGYDKDFLDSLCFYMTTNTAINVGSFVMILKAFMTQAPA